MDPPARRNATNMVDRPALPSERVAPLQSFLEQWTTRIRPMKSPEEAFQEKYEGTRALFNDVLRPLESDSEAPDDQDSRLDSLLDYGKQFKELKVQHEAEKQNEEREYQDMLWRQQKSLAFDLLDIFGRFLSDVVVKEWRERAAQLSSASTQPNSIPDRIDSQPTNPTTPPSSNDRQHSPRQAPIIDEPATQNPTNESIPTPPTTEDTIEQGTSSNETQPNESGQSVSTTQQKRRACPPSIDTTRYEKRLRFDDLPDPLTGTRSIEFEQVFQDGNAEVRYVIAPYNEGWYILECKKHKKHFLKSPLNGATRHLGSEAHGGLRTNYPETIRMLGTRVLNCNEELAEMNNRVARRSSYDELGRPESSMTLSATSAPSGNNGPHTRSSDAIPGIDPQPGEIYTTFWKGDRTFYAVLILPWGSFRQLGWDMSLKDTQLMKNVPSCYIYDPEAGLEAVQWASAYKPGGASFAKRKYPVIYFDAEKFAEDCFFDWVAACDLQPFDPHDEGIPFRNTIEEFIACQRPFTENELEEPRSSASNHDNVAGINTTHGNASAMSDPQPTTHTHPAKERFSAPGSGELIVISDDDDEPDERSITQTYQHDKREVKQSPQPSTPERRDHRVTEDDRSHRPQGVMESDQHHSRMGMFNHPSDGNQQGGETNDADSDAQARTGDNNTLSWNSNLMGSAEYLESLNPFDQPSTNNTNTNTLQQSDHTSESVSANIQRDQTAPVPRESARLNNVPSNARLEAYTKTIDDTRVHYRFDPTKGFYPVSIGNTATRNPHPNSPSQQATTSHPTNNNQANTAIAPSPSSQQPATAASQAANGISTEHLQTDQAPLMREANEHAQLARDAMEKYHWVGALSPVKPTAPPAPMVQRGLNDKKSTGRRLDEDTPPR
ncbi:hypothetical protein ACHAPJ_010163 [Fusarium lateritium]